MPSLLFSTTHGLVKKTPLDEYHNIRRSGLVAIKLDAEDHLLAVKPTTGDDDILLVSSRGKCIRFAEDKIRSTGRATRGVRGIRLKTGDRVVSMLVISKKLPSSPAANGSPDKKQKQAELLPTDNKRGQEESETLAAVAPPDQVLIVTENGCGKKTKLTEYPRKGRGGQGIFTAKVGTKTGYVVNAYLVSSKDKESDLLIISRHSKMIRLPLTQVPELGRHTQGVRLFRLDEGDAVASLTLL